MMQRWLPAVLAIALVAGECVGWEWPLSWTMPDLGFAVTPFAGVVTAVSSRTKGLDEGDRIISIEGVSADRRGQARVPGTVVPGDTLDLIVSGSARGTREVRIMVERGWHRGAVVAIAALFVAACVSVSRKVGSVAMTWAGAGAGILISTTVLTIAWSEDAFGLVPAWMAFGAVVFPTRFIAILSSRLHPRMPRWLRLMLIWAALIAGLAAAVLVMLDRLGPAQWIRIHESALDSLAWWTAFFWRYILLNVAILLIVAGSDRDQSIPQ